SSSIPAIAGPRNPRPSRLSTKPRPRRLTALHYTNRSPVCITDFAMTDSGTPIGKRRRAPQARAEATRDRILKVARALFSEQGYERTSLHAVQAQSGVTRGGLF